MADATWRRWAAEPAALLFRRRCDGSLHPRRLQDKYSLAALAITFAIHALLGAGLRHASVPYTSVSRQEQEHVLEVVWIERPDTSSSPPLPSASTRAPRDRVRREPARTPHVNRRAESSSMPASAADALLTTAVIPAVADDAWQALPERGRSKASDIDAPTFRRNPLARRDTTFDPPPARMEDAIQDRSFGGWMQRASKKRTCADLRAQLSRAPESTYTIIESMRKRGCKG